MGRGGLESPGLVTEGESRVFYTLYLWVRKVPLAVRLPNQIQTKEC